MASPKLLHVPSDSSAGPAQNIDVDRVGIERLFVEVPPSVHAEVRKKAMPRRVKEYVLEQIAARLGSGDALAIHEIRSPVPSASRQKRIIIEVNGAKAAELKKAAAAFGSFRELVLCCLEADGIKMPKRPVFDSLDYAD